MKQLNVKNLKESATMILTVYLGLILGVYSMNNIPSAMAKYAAAAVGLIGPFAVKNTTLKTLLAVVGAAGTAKIVKDMTEGKTGILSTVNSFAPTLSGVRGLGNANYYLGNMPSAPISERLALGNMPAEAQASFSDMLSSAN